MSIAGAVVLQGANNLFAATTTAPSTMALLPIPAESQSEAVARLSGGGDQPNAADDPFSLTGEPARVRDLVLASEADAPR